MPLYQQAASSAVPAQTSPGQVGGGGVIESPGGIGAIAANVATAGTTEKAVLSIAVPANLMGVATVFRCQVWGRVTTAGSVGTNLTFRVRIGSTTLTGNIPVSFVTVVSNSSSSLDFHITALVTVRTSGSSGTATGSLVFVTNNSNGVTSGFGPGSPTGIGTTGGGTVAVDTTANKLFEFTMQCANLNNTLTAYQAVGEVVNM